MQSTILNVKRSIRSLVIGSAVTDLPDRRSLRSSLAWHRHRIEEINGQMEMSYVRGNPRRHCELALQREHHEDMVALLTANLRRPQLTPNDRAMQAGWHSQLEAARQALVA